MRRVNLFIIGTLWVCMAVLASCDKDETEPYDFEAIDKEEIEDPDDRGNS